MKLHTLGQKHGQSIKDQIIKRFREIGFISLGEVKEIAGDFALRDDKYTGWDDESDLDRKIRVRETKKGWFVYLPEPNAIIKIGVEEPENRDFFKTWDDFNAHTEEQINKELEALELIAKSISLIPQAIIEYAVSWGYTYRPCIVKAKKSGLKEERKDRIARFHRWADVTKSVSQVVAIVEYYDGHVEQVQPNRIVFTDKKGEEENESN